MVLLSLLSEFGKFFQIVLWIVMPVFFISALITVYFHYRKRKKEEVGLPPPGLELAGNPFIIPPVKGPVHILFDHSKLAREFRNALTRNHAKFSALRNDYDKLQQQYSGLYEQMKNISPQLKENFMEQFQEEIANDKFRIQQLEEKIAELENSDLQNQLDDKIKELELLQQEKQTGVAIIHNLERQIDDLKKKSAELNQSFLVLKEENFSLKEMNSAMNNSQNSTNDLQPGKQNWEDEKAVLHEKIAALEYLEDLTEEKSKQIEFLQQQLEQRIRQNKQLDNQYKEIKEQVDTLQAGHEKDVQSLIFQLEEKNKEAEGYSKFLEEVKSQSQQVRDAFNQKEDELKQLIVTNQELREVNGTYNAQMQEKQNEIIQLKQKEEQLLGKIAEMEQNTARYRELFKNWHQQLGELMELKEAASPVIHINQAYSETEPKTGWN